MSGLKDGTKQDRLAAEAASDVSVVAKGGAVQIAGQISSRGLGFLFQAVVVRTLGTAVLGRYRLIAQILAIAGQLAILGFNYASVRFMTRARARSDPGAVRGAIRTGIAGTIVMSAFITVLLVLFAGPVSSLFDREDAEFVRLLRIGAAYVPLFALMQTVRHCTQSYKTMVPSVIAGNIVQPLARFVLGVAALIAGMHLAGLIGSLALSAGVGALVAAYFLRRMMTEDERAATPRYEIGAMLRFALPQSGVSLLGIQSLGLGILILGMYVPDGEVGLFAIALALQGPGGVFLGGIVNIWAPVVSDLYERGEIARLEALYQTITRWVATFSFPVFALLMIEPDLFVRLFAAEVGRGAETIVVVLALGNFFYTGTGPTGHLLSMTGRPGLNFVYSVVGVVLYAVLGVLVVPTHGALGMAVVDAVVTAVINSARVVQVKILVGIQPFGRSFLKPVIATAAGAVVLLAWRLVPGASLLLDVAGVVVAAPVYLLVLRAQGLDPEERFVWDRIRSRALRRKAPAE